ncbi:4002_t:CDS:2 [Acaulospora colombiana]|uniref:4002_t:CDS:1 n=1 Tax=Acaulospora colombiana TaxID=27376 RepID=A0ACA9LBN3_9GLOM|nr:4002_t:CDS:2 [Acaulospora colombiana]
MVLRSLWDWFDNLLSDDGLSLIHDFDFCFIAQNLFKDLNEYFSRNI